ncbi:MAG: DUF4303 domain-containing protein [Myxococcales bacterium]|nr:DUF4303 domain-containing protein [Myxococcales bacterium]
MAFDWKAFELALLTEVRAALTTFAKRHRREHFYAVALCGVYRQLDGPLSLPAIAVSSIEKGPSVQSPQSFWSARFSPPDWPYQLELRHAAALRLEKQLTAEATRSSVGHWRSTERRYFRVLLMVTRSLKKDVVGMLACTDDFVCYWHDDEGGPELARKTIDTRRWNRLFSREAAQKREQRTLARQSPHERAVALVARFGQSEGITSEKAQVALLAMGPDAVDSLVAALGDTTHGWMAARVLGQIGIATPVVVAGLRKRAEELWFAMALGMLGDHAWLARQKTDVAVKGLCARLKAITQGGPPRPLDYAPLEAWLEKNPSAVSRVESELAPGRSFVTIEKADVAAAVRGLSSRFAVVRWHAASVLRRRELGAAAGVTVLPALVTTLGDRHALVRRLAVLSLSGWKAAARPFYPAIRALRDDPDPVVRDVAAAVSRE